MKLLTLFAGVFAGLGIGLSGASPLTIKDTQMRLQVISDKGVQVCLDPAYGSDAGPGVLAVHAFAPDGDGWAGIEATSVLTGQTSLFGIFPGGAFRAETDADARRFFLPEGAGDCYFIKLIGDGQATAEIGLERSKP